MKLTKELMRESAVMSVNSLQTQRETSVAARFNDGDTSASLIDSTVELNSFVVWIPVRQNETD